jgi:hypothetical protein
LIDEENVLAPVPHRQYVFTVPRMLRPIFSRTRGLLGELCRIVERLLIRAYTGAGVEGRPGLILFVQTFGDLLTFNPHIAGMVVYRSHMHKGLKRNFQLMPGAQWLELLCRHIPDRFEHLVRYVGWYSTRVRGDRPRKAVPGAAVQAHAPCQVFPTYQPGERWRRMSAGVASRNATTGRA